MPGKPPPLIVLDACVLAGTIRRHVLLSFAEAGTFRPIWSQRILDEMERAIPKAMARASLPASDHPAHAARIRHLMNLAFPEACQPFLPDQREIILPDPDDGHVVALALQSGAKVIVTENLRDFPRKTLAPLGLIAINTDQFLLGLDMPDTARLHTLLDRLETRIDRQSVDRTRILETMKRVGLKKLSRKLAAL